MMYLGCNSMKKMGRKTMVVIAKSVDIEKEE